jgi:hypothetical protein
MDTKELRINNLINYDGKTIKVSGIIGNTIYHSSYDKDGHFFDSNIGDYKPFQPISLTEEWLVRLGFEYHRESGLYNKSGYDVMITSNGIDFYLGEYGSWYKNITTIHQLQNLYFALTGEELTINE